MDSSAKTSAGSNRSKEKPKGRQIAAESLSPAHLFEDSEDLNFDKHFKQKATPRKKLSQIYSSIFKNNVPEVKPHSLVRAIRILSDRPISFAKGEDMVLPFEVEFTRLFCYKCEATNSAANFISLRSVFERWSRGEDRSMQFFILRKKHLTTFTHEDNLSVMRVSNEQVSKSPKRLSLISLDNKPTYIEYTNKMIHLQIQSLLKDFRVSDGRHQIYANFYFEGARCHFPKTSIYSKQAGRRLMGRARVQSAMDIVKEARAQEHYQFQARGIFTASQIAEIASDFRKKQIQFTFEIQQFLEL